MGLAFQPSFCSGTPESGPLIARKLSDYTLCLYTGADYLALSYIQLPVIKLFIPEKRMLQQA